MTNRLLSVSVFFLLPILSTVMWARSASERAAEHIFQLSTTLACIQRSAPIECQVVQFSKQDLGHNVAYYKALIKIGPGDYDVIGVNRLVREARGAIPVHTVGSFFFIHGSSEDFHMAMISLHGGLGVFLAERNIDVWGIDLRNVQIPVTVTDLSFAADWGLNVQIQDTLVATRIVRWVRALTGQGWGQIILGGHSSGATLTFAAANTEAVLSPKDRDIAAIIPIEIIYKLPPDATEQSDLSCGISEFYREAVTSGVFFFDNIASIHMGQVAKTDPDGISTDGAPLTNLQYLMENAGGLWFAGIYPIHAFTVLRDSSGIATQGRYSSTADILETYIGQPVYPIPNAMDADMFGVSCFTIDTPYDDNLGQIKVPVLYIGAAGGFGKVAEYTMQLLGSSDITIIMMQVLSDADAVNDFGHMEPFTASKSKQLVWQPMHAWIVAHSN